MNLLRFQQSTIHEPFYDLSLSLPTLTRNGATAATAAAVDGNANDDDNDEEDGGGKGGGKGGKKKLSKNQLKKAKRQTIATTPHAVEDVAPRIVSADLLAQHDARNARAVDDNDDDGDGATTTSLPSCLRAYTAPEVRNVVVVVFFLNDVFFFE